MPQNRPIEEAGEAALREVREHGLSGRADSPLDWDAVLNGARAGEPIFVKDPDDSRDDFYLVPLIPANPASIRGAWVMLDPQTLKLREASLLENWKALAFPDDDSGDAEKASKQTHTLPDGTLAKFKKEDLKPNTKNLVWKVSAASMLPYWPLKEWTAPHPVTGLPVSIYATQDGEIYSQLLPDEVETKAEGPKKEYQKMPQKVAKPPSKALNVILGCMSLGLLVSTIYFASSGNKAEDEAAKVLEEQRGKLDDGNTQIDDQQKLIDELNREIVRLKENQSDQIISLENQNKQVRNENIELKRKLSSQLATIKQHEIKIKELEVIKTKYLTEINGQKTVISRLEKEIETLKRAGGSMQDLQREITGCQRRVKDLERQIAKLNQEKEGETRLKIDWERKYRGVILELQKNKALLASKDQLIDRLTKQIQDFFKKRKDGDGRKDKP